MNHKDCLFEVEEIKTGEPVKVFGVDFYEEIRSTYFLVYIQQKIGGYFAWREADDFKPYSEIQNTQLTKE